MVFKVSCEVRPKTLLKITKMDAGSKQEDDAYLISLYTRTRTTTIGSLDLWRIITELDVCGVVEGKEHACMIHHATGTLK